MIQYNEDALKRQKELQKAGFYFGKLDGLWGAKSKQAERMYLQSIGKLVQPEEKPMKLRDHRCAFTADMARLIQFANENGFECAGDDLKSREACGVHMSGSQHFKGLAIDLLLYKKGRYLTRTKDHAACGEFWESLSPYNRWGGRYSDGNHYERLEYLWQENAKAKA